MTKTKTKKEKVLKLEEYTVSGLYYRYGKISDDEIREYLKTIKIVGLGDNGIGTVHGYYEISDRLMERVLKKPREFSYQFEMELSNRLVNGLVPYKRIVFLVKSTSSFFLRPDIGEVFDAINHHDLYGNQIKAIWMEKGYVKLPGTDGEHFLMFATIFK